MSLRLRILLLIVAVNVGVLLLVVCLGLKSAETAAPVGPQAILEAWRAAFAEDLSDEQPWNSLRYVIRQPTGYDEWDWAVPADDEEEAQRVRQRLIQQLREGEESVTWEMILETMKKNSDRVIRLFLDVIPKITEYDDICSG